jgi:hypothetical protein
MGGGGKGAFWFGASILVDDDRGCATLCAFDELTFSTGAQTTRRSSNAVREGYAN